jgi:hypothetical protein
MPQLSSGHGAAHLAKQPKRRKVEAMHTVHKNVFVRDPILENRIFFLKSTCSNCGFSIHASSAEQLLEEEEQHRQECTAHNRLRFQKPRVQH